jgi:hypothetical protein
MPEPCRRVGAWVECGRLATYRHEPVDEPRQQVRGGEAGGVGVGGGQAQRGREEQLQRVALDLWEGEGGVLSGTQGES